jgi:hypothetical protein
VPIPAPFGRKMMVVFCFFWNKNIFPSKERFFNLFKKKCMEKKISDAACEAIKENTGRGTFFGFIPHRLEIKEFPEYDNFPFNILFVSYANIDGVNTSGSAVYYPDLSTFQEGEEKQSMTYYNQYDEKRNWTVVIEYDKQRKSWEGTKYCKGEFKGCGGGTEWNMAFAHLTALGVTNGERVKFEKM